MARRHPIAVAIKQYADEKAGWASFSAIVVLGGVAGELGLDSIPERLIDDRIMSAKIRLSVVNDVAPIDAVLQHQIECAAGEWFPTRDAARGARSQLAPDAPGLQFVLQQPDRAEFGVVPKDEAHDFRLTAVWPRACAR